MTYSGCRCAQLGELLGGEAVEYSSGHLTRTGVADGAWTTFLRCHQTGITFIMDYPRSELHGGGPPRLRRQA